MTTTAMLGRPAGFQGELITPRSDGYDAARRVWNRAIDRFPAAVLRCTCTEDVRLALALARDARLPVAVRGGGHSMAGMSTCDDGVVIDLSAMTEVTVDPHQRTATAGPGLLWRDFDRATQEHGLAVPGGEVSDTASPASPWAGGSAGSGASTG